MQTYNISPYHDDYDEHKDFHQILFKPGYAVQARELTQLQTILRSQIEKFGNHIFKHGQIVIPGNSNAEIGVDCIRLNSQYAGKYVNTSMFTDRVIIGATQNVKAYVKKIVDASSSSPLTFFISYISAGVDTVTGVTRNTFIPGEKIYLEVSIDDAVELYDADSIGKGQMAYVNRGVYYVNGTFVSVEKQSVVLPYDTTVATPNPIIPHCHVLLKITESIVDYTVDESLLDSAQGSFNYSAPGADRVKISLELVALPYGATFSNDYVELMRYKNGDLEEHARFPKYNELEKSMARRTFDESGNYVVNGLRVSIQEHMKTATNGGMYLNGDEQKLIYSTTSGKAYIQGLEVENLQPKKFIVSKPRTDYVTKNFKKSVNYGQYVLVIVNGNATSALPAAGQLIKFLDGASTIVATAIFLGVDFYVGDTWGARRVDKLYISDLKYMSSMSDVELRTCNNITNTAGASFAYMVTELRAAFANGVNVNPGTIVTTSGTRAATAIGYNQQSGMLYVNRQGTSLIPTVGDTITHIGASAKVQSQNIIFTETTDNLVIYLGRNGVKSVKPDGVNATPDLDYTKWTKFELAYHSVSSSVTSGTIVSIDTGTAVAYNNAGPVSIGEFSTDGTAITHKSSQVVNGPFVVYAQVRLSGAAPRSKQVTQFDNYSGIQAPDGSITLPHPDVVDIISVNFTGVVIGAPTVDITNNYILDRNCSDFSYNKSVLRLRSGLQKLSSGNIAISYKYLSHGTNDYFSADSYTGVPEKYIETRVNPLTGQSISVKDCLDFRTSSSNPIVPGTQLETSVQYYLPRIDNICLDTKGNIVVLEGTPSEDPKPTTITEGLYNLQQVYLPANTQSVEDIKSKRVSVDRYRMEDIKLIEKRIDNLEEFATLTAAEQNIVQTSVIDAATGLERFKTGYLVENVQDPFLIADVLAEGYSASTSPEDGIYCRLENDNIGLTLVIPTSDITNISVKDGGFVTLSYTEELFCAVTVSSRITNVNPFAVVGWSGVMKLIPSFDYWVESLYLPSITLKRNAWAWSTSPGSIPPIVPLTPDTDPTYTPVGNVIQLPNGNTAVHSGPSDIQIDTIMGWDARTRSQSVWEFPNLPSGLNFLN